MSLLVLDIGNSRIKWMMQGQAYSATSDQFGSCFTASIKANPERIVICSVAAQDVTQGVVDTLAACLPRVPMSFFESSLRLKNFRQGYDQPAQLGPDRWAACIGARQFCRSGALLVASFGTATTLDVMTDDNCFLGGVILPGPELMARALSQNTARLPEVNWDKAGRDIPSDTQSAIAEGVLRAQLGALELSRQRAELVLAAPVQVVATGGAVHCLHHRLPAQAQSVEHLVLHGLASIATELE
jgi:type III pantothenate kinase